MSEQKELTEFESHLLTQMETLGQAINHHQFVLQALTATVSDMQKHMPDEPGSDQKQGEGETRGKTTVFRLPGGYGVLAVTISDDDRALLDYKNAGTRERATMQFKKAR